MNEVISFLLDFAMFFLMVCIVERSNIANNLKRAAFGMAFFTISGIVIIGFIRNEAIQEVVSFVTIVLTVAIIYDRGFKKYMLPCVTAVIINSVVEGFVQLIVPLATENDVLRKLITICIILIFSTIVIFFLKTKINFSILPRKLLIEIGMLFFSVGALITGISVFVDTNDDNSTRYLLYVAVVTCIAVFGVAIEGIMLEISKLTLQKENKMLQHYNEQQKNYYELMLKSEEDTRRFRHDMMNHMFCLEEYLKEDKIDDCINYISNITNDISKRRKNLYQTGNRIADVMLTNILENKKEDVKVSVVGNLKDDIGISDYDLCIVISNIVKNAVEAVNRQANTSEKYINIKFTVGKRFFRIEETNTIDEEQINNAKKLETAKDDKRHHGLGVKNVKMIVEKYSGTFERKVTNNEFYVCVDMEMRNA